MAKEPKDDSKESLRRLLDCAERDWLESQQQLRAAQMRIRLLEGILRKHLALSIRRSGKPAAIVKSQLAIDAALRARPTSTRRDAQERRQLQIDQALQA
jgi:hypothetical protein